MTLPTVQLVERRAREVRLPRGDVAFLLAHARHLVEVVPTFRHGVYRITPRGYVGWFDTPSCRIAIAPKIPWPNLRMLLGLPPAEYPGAAEIEPDAGFLDMLAREFTAQLRAVARVGLVPGYREDESASAFLRGKLRPGEQMRDAAARAFPDRFHITESILDLDTPWNRIPRAIADALLLTHKLSPTTDNALRQAISVLNEVSISSVTAIDFVAAANEPRAAHYSGLLQVCRWLHDIMQAAQLPGTGRDAFLLDLSRAFERYLCRGLSVEFDLKPGWSLEAQPGFPVGPTTLQPDILIRHHGKPRVVLDAKWKAPGTAPDAGDLHQILAYSAITGTRHVGLVYPGRRFARRAFSVAGTELRVSLIRVQVVGTAAECAVSLAKLRRFVCRNRA